MEDTTVTSPDGKPVPETPDLRTPTSGAPEPGDPAPGAQALREPESAVPASPLPSSGAPMSGAPISGAPASGAPASGAPASGAPASGAPASGAPVSGAPVLKAHAPAASSDSANDPGMNSEFTQNMYPLNLDRLLRARIPTIKFIRNALRVPLNKLYAHCFVRFSEATTPDDRLLTFLYLIAIPKCVLRDPIPRKEPRRSAKAVTRAIDARIQRALNGEWSALFSEAVAAFDPTLSLLPEHEQTSQPPSSMATDESIDDPRPSIRPLQPALPVDPDSLPVVEEITRVSIRHTLRRLNTQSPAGADGLRVAFLKALLLCPGAKEDSEDAVQQLVFFLHAYVSGALLASALPPSAATLFCEQRHCRDHMGCALPILHLACCSRAIPRPTSEGQTSAAADDVDILGSEEERIPADGLAGAPDTQVDKAEEEVGKLVSQEETEPSGAAEPEAPTEGGSGTSVPDESKAAAEAKP